MPGAIAFDVYGTLVDPLEMGERLRPVVGEGLAESMAKLWREKQLEYTFRRALMRRYEDFDACTRQALDYAIEALGAELSGADRERLISEYVNLSPFADVAPGLEEMRAAGHALVAFSNGVEATLRSLLERAGILPLLDGVVSVDAVTSFKPDPEVYRYLCRRLDRPPSGVWLVSSNPFDVIGAKNVGLSAAWVKRGPAALFDPWGIEPDLVVPDLRDLAAKL
ncbi:haloacid dehalogenase type II [Rubrobacter marinus]|uniref:Haloacid dehalogenase type II n=1 Tax=Rubrobacter marinus TaxID=2653852 RepID=A0A6G8PWV7_9ACTN|nr:haloacid dehalogenase type II [Rubrobacter marinus]QIN78680.1 haloacid dehalogenase type II [Rubrobacter marinus]